MDVFDLNTFNWQEYVSLNFYFNIPNNYPEALEHFINIGCIYGLNYKFKNIQVLIYSAGKTGTASLKKSFDKILPSNYVFSLHNDEYMVYHNVNDIINCQRENKILMLCSYREPISQYISFFFQNIENKFGSSIDEILKLDIEVILQKIINDIYGDDWLVHPFLENDKKNFDNINIFDTAFDKNNGYQIFETERVKIILLKFDKIDKWQEIIRNNTIYSEFELISANLTIDKPVYDLYKKVLNQIIIPKSILDDIYTMEESNMKYFYTDEEIIKIKNKWYH
jgi:hypothetical protein